MTDISITISPDGNGTVAIDGQPQPVQGQTIEESRQQAMERAISHTRATGQAATVTAEDPTGTFHLTVHPDGTITNQPTPERAPLAEISEDQAAAPVITEVPHAQDASDLEATRPRPAPTPESVVQRTDLGAADAVPAPEPPTSSTPDPLETDARWIDLSQQPAEQGFRGALNGMGLKIGPSPVELEQRRETLRRDIGREQREQAAAEEEARTQTAQETRRAARAREEAQRDKEQRSLIQTNFGECQTITVSNQKGGSHKTTVIALLAATFGRLRGGGVIAWDANETMGTLGDRTMEDLHSNTVVDLLEKSAKDFSSVETSRIGTIDKYTRPQGDNHFTVLASDEDPERQDMVDDTGFRTVHEILSRFNRMIFVDTGNNARAEHFLAAIEATNQLVIPVSAGLDSALVAEKMIKALTARGHEDLVQKAVVMLHDSESRKANDTDTARRFEGKVTAVIPVPFDPALKDGGKIDYDELQPATRRAYQEAAAAIAQNLRNKIKESQA